MKDHRAYWDMLEEEETEDALALLTKTKENPFGTPRFAVSAAMSCWADGLEMAGRRLDSGYVETRYEGDVAAGEDVVMEKYALCFTSRDYDEKVLSTLSLKAAARAREVGYDALRDAHTAAWRDRRMACPLGRLRRDHSGRRRGPAGHPLQPLPAAQHLFGR